MVSHHFVLGIATHKGNNRITTLTSAISTEAPKNGNLSFLVIPELHPG